MNEWRAMHMLDTAALTSALSTMSAITMTPMSTSTNPSTKETSMMMKEAGSRQDKTRYISGKLVTVQKRSTEASNEETPLTTKEGEREGDSRSYNQNCCTIFLTDSGKLCTKL